MLPGMTTFIAGGSPAFEGYTTDYTTPGTQTVSVPPGASGLIIELVGRGADGFSGEDDRSGGGGSFTRTGAISFFGLTSVYLDIPASAGGSFVTARANDSSGTILGRAQSGSLNNPGEPQSGYGGISYRGGPGANYERGGGAAGPGGDGGDGSGGGISGGAPGGNGGSYPNGNGQNYGGGGGAATGLGAPALIRLIWS